MRKLIAILLSSFFFCSSTIFAEDFWVYIQAEDDLTGGPQFEGHSMKGDIIDVVSTKQGDGNYNQSKDFLIIKVLNLSSADVIRLKRYLTKDNGDVLKVLSESKYQINLNALQAIHGIDIKKGTRPTGIPAVLFNNFIIEKTEQSINGFMMKSYMYGLVKGIYRLFDFWVPNAYATTTYVRYVDPDAAAGGDGTTNALSGANCAYQSLSIWENARDDVGGLVAADTIEEAVVDSNHASHTADTTRCQINGWTTGSANYIYIHTPTTSRHAGVWTDSKYRINVADDDVIDFYEDYIRVDGLQLRTHTPTANSRPVIYVAALSAGANEIRISNCIMRANNSSTYSSMPININSANVVVKMWNILGYDHYEHGSNGNYLWMYLNNTGTISVYSSTFIGGHTGIDRRSGTITGKNVYVKAGVGSAYNGLTQTTCAADDATADGTSLDNIAYNTTNFTNVTAGSENLHLPAGSALINVGTDTSGDADPLNFTTDIDQETRSGTWDIGADEYVAASGGGAFHLRRRIITTQ